MFDHAKVFWLIVASEQSFLFHSWELFILDCYILVLWDGEWVLFLELKWFCTTLRGIVAIEALNDAMQYLLLATWIWFGSLDTDTYMPTMSLSYGTDTSQAVFTFFITVLFYYCIIYSLHTHTIYSLVIYTVVHKKGATFIFSITLANIDGFS